jgi:hypothetical protein
MARLKIESVLDHLSVDMRQALYETVRKASPDAEVDAFGLYREFVGAVRQKCQTWEPIPDAYVDKD